MGGAVIRIVLNGAHQHPLSRCRLPFFHVRAAEHDVGRAVKRVEPDGFLQRGDTLVPLGLPHSRIPELIERHGVGRIESDFAFGQRDAFLQAPAENRDLPQKRVSLRQRRILLDGAFQLGLGERLELEPDHHLRGNEVGGGGIGGYSIRTGKYRTGAISLMGLHVGLPEHVPEFGVPRPQPRGLEPRHRVSVAAGQKARQTEHLDGFATLDRVLGKLCDHRCEAGDCADVVVGAVVCDPQQSCDVGLGRIGESAELFDRGTGLPLIDQAPGVRHHGRAFARRVLRGGSCRRKWTGQINQRDTNATEM
jgi:hypothetical protein